MSVTLLIKILCNYAYQFNICLGFATFVEVFLKDKRFPINFTIKNFCIPTELYKFSELFSCSLDEDDMEANQTIEELLCPKSHV